jgi:hypothetical protein
MELPTHIMQLAKTNSLEPRIFVDWCQEFGGNALDAANSLALEIARQYSIGELDYVFCDRVINSLSLAAWSEEFFSITDRETPKVLDEIYLAFDAGEYYHPEDKPNDDPEVKYTRPMISEILERNQSV